MVEGGLSCVIIWMYPTETFLSARQILSIILCCYPKVLENNPAWQCTSQRQTWGCWFWYQKFPLIHLIPGCHQIEVHFLGLSQNRNSWSKPNNCSFSGYRTLIPDGCKTFIVTLLTGSDMSVVNSGPKRKNYSDLAISILE